MRELSEAIEQAFAQYEECVRRLEKFDTRLEQVRAQLRQAGYLSEDFRGLERSEVPATPEPRSPKMPDIQGPGKRGLADVGVSAPA
jgi:hypothetical protein